jgi:3-oxoacyl-[acyl-carrier-protein] synthase II
MDTVLAQVRELDNGGPRKVSPHTLTRLMVNGPSAWVSIDLGAKGGARTPVSACASGAEAIAQGAEMIRSGAADVVVAGGVDACVNDLIIAGFSQIRALSTRNDEPERASRPFDRDRDGFVLSEGAGIVVLESENHARARGAEVLGGIAGAAVTSDANDIVAADPDMQVRVMQKALASAGLHGTDIGFVHAHATSTPVGDRLEAQAIKAIAGDQVPVTSTKSLTGHLLGGAGALAAIATLQALRTGDLPGTYNVASLDPEVDLNVITSTVRGSTATAGLVNAFGFGGHSAALVVTGARRYRFLVRTRAVVPAARPSRPAPRPAMPNVLSGAAVAGVVDDAAEASAAAVSAAAVSAAAGPAAGAAAGAAWECSSAAAVVTKEGTGCSGSAPPAVSGWFQLTTVPSE